MDNLKEDINKSKNVLDHANGQSVYDEDDFFSILNENTLSEEYDVFKDPNRMERAFKKIGYFLAEADQEGILEKATEIMKNAYQLSKVRGDEIHNKMNVSRSEISEAANILKNN